MPEHYRIDQTKTLVQHYDITLNSSGVRVGSIQEQPIGTWDSTTPFDAEGGPAHNHISSDAAITHLLENYRQHCTAELGCADRALLEHRWKEKK
jgi:hypothetical protein